MHIAVAGPATLSVVAPLVNQTIDVPGYPFAGTSLLIEEYLNLGHYVSLITTSPELPDVITFRGKNFQVVVVPSRVRARDRAIDQFRRERDYITQALHTVAPDVVHAHWTYEFGLAAQASKLPCLITVHDWAPEIARQNRHLYWNIRALMQWRCLRGPGKFTVPSEYLQNLMRERNKSATVVPNGIRLPTVSRPPHSTGPERQDVRMLNVGFSSRKNVKIALTAWPDVLKMCPKAKLTLAGPDYEPGGPAAQWAQLHRLHDGVQFIGPLEPGRVHNYLSGAGCFLHTSLEESFGLAAVEALAAGTPIIVGEKSGALPFITAPAAILCNVQDPKAVARSVISLITAAPDQVQRRSEIGLEVAARFDIKTVAERYESLLRNQL